MEPLSVILLAAGDGKRMRSRKPKVLCEVLFKPMILWLTDACARAGVRRCAAVIGRGGQEVAAALPDWVETVEQKERLGTGHAVMQCVPFLRECTGTVAVLGGDAPFVDEDLILAAARLRREENAAAVVVTARLRDPSGYGRILRDPEGNVRGIVEQADATEEEKAIDEINSGLYLFEAQALLEALPRLRNDNAQGEYYLTDVLGILLEDGKKVCALAADESAVLGANDREGLLALNEIARRRVLRAHMKNGVEFLSTDGVIIGPDVRIGPDTAILPGTILRGNTVIGASCRIGPGALIENGTVGDGSEVVHAQILGAVLPPGSRPESYTVIKGSASR